MIETKKLLKELAKRFPKKYAKVYHDYVGLMTGKLPEKLNKILLCLVLAKYTKRNLEHHLLAKIKKKFRTVGLLFHLKKMTRKIMKKM